MNSKLKNGYVAEEKFILECLSRNIPIIRPIYNVEPYDFVIQTVNGFRSVQVKKSWIDKKGRNVVSIKSSYPRSSRTRYVNEDSADYLAVLVDYWDWYIIPCSAFVGKTSNICVSKQGAYSKFLNNWNFEQGAVPCPQHGNVAQWESTVKKIRNGCRFDSCRSHLMRKTHFIRR